MHPCYLVQFGASEHRTIIFEELLFYYVFKFEQTATYYARLDVVVLREFYPTFDSITIFAELPLGQGIFFSCVVQNRKGSSEVFFHKPIYILTLLSCSIVFCNVWKKIQFPIYLWPAKIVWKRRLYDWPINFLIPKYITYFFFFQFLLKKIWAKSFILRYRQRFCN